MNIKLKSHLALLLVIASSAITFSLQGQISIDFSQKRGYYQSTVQLELSTDNPRATIRYTTDNSVPTQTNGQQYIKPISIDNFATIRAIAYTDTEESKIKTHTYFVLPKLLNQPYFKTHITQDPTWIDQLDDALLALPTMVITKADTSLIDETTSAISLEYFDPAIQDNFQINCGVKKYGGVSVRSPKHNMRLYFNAEYGEKKLKYPLFEGFESGISAVKEFDQIELRGDSQNSWLGGFSSLYIGPRFADNTMLEMGERNTHGRYVHLFVNGDYRGQYHLRERMNEDFMASYYGDPKEAYEMIDDDGGNLSRGNWLSREPAFGTGEIWQSLVDRSNDFHAWKEGLNTNSFFDFMLVFMYGQHENEYKTVGGSEPDNRFIFRVNDGDGFFDIYDGIRGDYHHDRTDPNGTNTLNAAGPDQMFKNLYNAGHPDFLMAFADRTHCHCFDNGVLTPARVVKRIDELVAQIETSLIAESAKWGDSNRTPATWMNDIQAVKNGYAKDRTDILIEQLKARTLYPASSAVQFSIDGGAITNAVSITLTHPNNAGTIYYRTDGIDPRLPGGGLHPNAIPYTGPFTLPNGSHEIKARVYDSQQTEVTAKWSAACPKIFYVNTSFDDLVINEIHYNPLEEERFNPITNTTETVSGKNFEFIEIKNTGNSIITLADSVFTKGIQLHLDTPIEIPARGFAVFAEDAFWFEQKYGFAPDGEYIGKLDNEGEQILLTDPLGKIVDQVAFEAEKLWDIHPSESGHSLELLFPDLDNTNGLNWFRSDKEGGTPKSDNSRICRNSAIPIIINEINYNSNNTVLSPGNWVELHNPSGARIDLFGWTLYDEQAAFVFSANTIIEPYGYLVLVEDRNEFQLAFPSVEESIIIGNLPFNLSNKGERLSLFDVNKCLADYVIYDDKSPWTKQADGEGPTLALRNPTQDNTIASAWDASTKLVATYLFGSPGVSNIAVVTCVEGFPCEDGDPCTTGEKYDANCNCVNGSFADADNDGVCNANDLCDNLDDRLILQPCDDGNPNTAYDHYNGRTCACEGILVQAIYCVYIEEGTDDTEEYIIDGTVDSYSSDLELTLEKSEQMIGLRFKDIPIPQGGVIESAYIQFTADETNSEPTNLSIQAEATGDAKKFGDAGFPISSRPTTTAIVNWKPPAWNRVGERGNAQRTTDIAPLVQEVVNRSDFEAGNEMAFLIAGTGKRVAESQEGNPAESAELCIIYSEAACVVGLACDDGNPQTVNDVYDADCNCVGKKDILFAKVLLEGFYDETTRQMHSQLKETNLIPLSQPFNQAPWNYLGTETLSTIPSKVTDWILVISRSADGTPLSQSVGFITQEGLLIGLDGTEGIVLDQVNGNYFSIHHRSHLAIISSQPYDGQRYDFTLTTNQAKGINQLKAVGGRYVLYAGDYDGTGIINNTDFNRWKRQSAALNQYLSIDGDGNGIINSRDYNLWINNRSKIGVLNIRYD